MEVLAATSGNDILGGTDGDDILAGGAGDDLLTGGAGNDRYGFARGDGADQIVNTGEGGSDDRLVFGDGVSQDQLWFSQSGNDLQVSIIGTNDSVTVQNWSDVNDRVAAFETSDGATLAAAQVDNLISAMASLTPPALDETELSDSLHDQLDTVLAASWSDSNS